ncbi:hypothetical protein [Roseomonas sp. 18066]|uniref:hypothetical protein n=1 Tax=Roseomonas sp. 18066 TaxID=2681412 RepID=UPI001357C92A|nr:hypothetical protein [Roseomonas sp. 18066]
MKDQLSGIRLYLVCGALAAFLAGLLHAIDRWDAAADDRAYVAAGRRALQAPPAERGTWVWMPAAGARLNPAVEAAMETRARIEQLRDEAQGRRKSGAP